MFDELGDVFIALGGDSDDAAGAGGDFLDVGEGFFVFEDGAGVGGVFGGEADDGKGFVDKGVGLRGGCGVQGKGAAAGVVGRKGWAVWAECASSGFFDCGRPGRASLRSE